MEPQTIPWRDASPPPNAQYVGDSLRKEGLSVSAIALPLGSMSPLSDGKFEECIWVVMGKADVKIDKKLYPLNAGDRLLVPQGQRYCVQTPFDSHVHCLVGKKWLQNPAEKS